MLSSILFLFLKKTLINYCWSAYKSNMLLLNRSGRLFYIIIRAFKNERDWHHAAFFFFLTQVSVHTRWFVPPFPHSSSLQ